MNHPHYEVNKSHEQHQLDLLYVAYNVFQENTYKYILTAVSVESKNKITRALRTKKMQ